MAGMFNSHGECQKCKQRPATETWSADGVMAAIHGIYQFWCKQCVLEEQIAYAKLQASRISELEKELEKLKEKE